MGKIQFSDVKPLQEYAAIRPEFRERMTRVKAARRVLVGPYLNFLFENRDTMLYQVQEMIRAESLSTESAIQHEIETYNELVPGPNELKATLLIEIDNPQMRAFKLAELVGLEKHISLLIDRDYQVQAEFDQRQIDPEKLSSVQFITFPLGEKATDAFLQTETVELLITHPACSYRMALSKDQISALRDDLISARSG